MFVLYVNDMKYNRTAIIVSVLTLLTVPVAVLAHQNTSVDKAAYTNSCPKGNCPKQEDGIIRDMPTNQDALSQASAPIGQAPDSAPAASSEDVAPSQTQTPIVDEPTPPTPSDPAANNTAFNPLTDTNPAAIGVPGLSN